MTETFIYYELHILGVRGPSWGTLPHKRIFFFPVFLLLSSAATFALRSLLPSRYALRNVLLIFMLLLIFVHNYVIIL